MIDNLTVNGLTFTNFHRSSCVTTLIGYNETKYIIKLETAPNPAKRRTLHQEADIIKYLNNKGCVTAPILFDVGALPDKTPYIIEEYLPSIRRAPLPDMVLALLEHKAFGVYQGDFKPDNARFDGVLCKLIDYDQCRVYDEFKEMGNVEFIEWVAKDFFNRSGIDFYQEESRQYNKAELFSWFKDDAFDLGTTELLKSQRTTLSTQCYSTLSHPKLFIDGNRDLSGRKTMLDKIPFKDNEQVLDIGCNLGLVSHYLYHKGCQVTGIDMDAPIIKAAQIVNNILGYDIVFKVQDIEHGELGTFDTICLFSALHHTSNVQTVCDIITQKCRRIILEEGLVETGRKYVDGVWEYTTNWNFGCVEDFVRYWEGIFQFKCFANYGVTERGRFVLEFTKPL